MSNKISMSTSLHPNPVLEVNLVSDLERACVDVGRVFLVSILLYEEVYEGGGEIKH